MGDRRRARRRRRLLRTVVVLVCAGMLTAAIWTDVNARTRTRREEYALKAADAYLVSLRRQVVITTGTRSATTTERNELEASIATTLSQLASTNASLSTVEVASYFQGKNISVLETCLGGIQNALSAIRANNNDAAATDISDVSAACTQLDGNSASGLVYPFDFPDPDVIVVGQTYYAYATNSVGGNIAIIKSTNLVNWTAVGNALPTLPSWASANQTWAPSVEQVAGGFDMYYAVDQTGSTTECISVASSASPQGPFVDSSTAPLECQPTLGGSIDPTVFVDSSGSSYLIWKSGGEGNSVIWSQQLNTTGTGFAMGSTAATILTPDQGWEGGTIEAPDMVLVGGHYLLFYSGNNWNTSSYAVGVATCTGPVGPCSDASPNPILSSGSGMSGPGGESVFQGTDGSYWMAFHAWDPSAVGFPNSRSLYILGLNLSSGVPSVGSPP